MQDKDSEATRASPDAPTWQNVTGPTLPAPELPMVGMTEAVPVHAPPPEAAPVIEAPPGIADLATRVGRMECYCDLLANGFIQQPAQPAPEGARQPQQEDQPETKQPKEEPVPGLNAAGADLLFATSSAGTTLFISKEAMIWLVVVVAGAFVLLYVYGHAGGTNGAPASA